MCNNNKLRPQARFFLAACALGLFADCVQVWRRLGVGRQLPLPPPDSDVDAFQRLLASRGKKSSGPVILKFIKKLEEILEIALPKEKPMKIALALAKRGLVGQFMGLWPSTKTTDDWIQRNWKPNLKHGVTCYPVGRGFFIFEFISEED